MLINGYHCVFLKIKSQPGTTIMSHLLCLLISVLKFCSLHAVLVEKLHPSSQEVPSSWNCKVYYHIHKSPTLACFEPDESNPYPKSYFNKIHINIILPSMPMSYEWSFPLRLSIIMSSTVSTPKTKIYTTCIAVYTWFVHK
jgi:hypothetical protein